MRSGRNRATRTHPQRLAATRFNGLSETVQRSPRYEATKRVGDAFRRHFSAERVQETQPTTASEDFGSFGTEWGAPCVFWFVGGIDPKMYSKAKNDGKLGEIPTNHNPRFAPVIHPTLETGVEAMVVAAKAWLGHRNAR